MPSFCDGPSGVPDIVSASVHSVVAREGSEAAAGEVLKEDTILPLIYQAL